MTTSLFPASTTMFVKIDKEKEMPVTREGASCSPRPQRGGCDPNGEGRFPVGATAAAGTTLGRRRRQPASKTTPITGMRPRVRTLRPWTVIEHVESLLRWRRWPHLAASSQREAGACLQKPAGAISIGGKWSRRPEESTASGHRGLRETAGQVP
jgi:hypothetical protein